MPTEPTTTTTTDLTTTGIKHQTREQWLLAAVNLLRPLFEHRSYPVPATVRVTCGWPSRSALSPKSKRIGECWSPDASADGTTEIFISPYLVEADSKGGVLATLVHEIVHAVVGLEAKHGKPFKKCATKIGLVGKMTATEAGDELLEVLKEIATQLGKYPHAKLDQLKSPRKAQTTRMVKCECKTCGYVVRTTRKWLEEVGAPHCPKHGAMFTEPPDTDADDTDNE